MGGPPWAYLGPSLWGALMLGSGFKKIQKVVKRKLKDIKFNLNIPAYTMKKSPQFCLCKG